MTGVEPTLFNTLLEIGILLGAMIFGIYKGAEKLGFIKRNGGSTNGANGTAVKTLVQIFTESQQALQAIADNEEDIVKQLEGINKKLERLPIIELELKAIEKAVDKLDGPR
jgi:hypothetical protein